MKRITIVILLCLAALFAASAVTKVHADPGASTYADDQANTYAIKFGDWVVCDTFRTRGVVPDTFDEIGLFLMKIGFTPKQAATVVKNSLLTHCPDLYDPVVAMAKARNSGKLVHT